MNFPKIYKFKYYMKRERRKKLTSIAQILSDSCTKDEFLHKLEDISERDIKAIERRTRDQSKNPDWFYYRQAVITGTLARRISLSAKKDEGCNHKINAAISKIDCQELYYLAIRYGRIMSRMLFKHLLKLCNHNIQTSKFILKVYSSIKPYPSSVPV